MTQTSTPQTIPAHFRYGFRPDENGRRTFTHEATGITVTLLAVMNGGMTRVDVRGSNGVLMPERSINRQFESHAVRDFVAVVEWLLLGGAAA